jgi:hypothetical protein
MHEMKIKMKDPTRLATAIGLRTALISGAAVARVADEPTGSAFQDRGYRDYLGFSFGRPHRTA